MTPLYGGLITWLVTTVLIDGFIFEGAREWVRHRAHAAGHRAVNAKVAVLRHKDDPNVPVTEESRQWVARELDARLSRQRRTRHRAEAWYKLAYMTGCHLCLGLWVGWAIALVVSGPLPHFLLNGLLYKAVGHLVLEVAALLKRVGHDHEMRGYDSLRPEAEHG